MTHEEKAREIVDTWRKEYFSNRISANARIEINIAEALVSAENKGREDTMRDNLLLNEIRNEQFALGKKQGWNEAIEAVVKIVLSKHYANNSELCLVGGWKCNLCEIADKIKELKKG